MIGGYAADKLRLPQVRPSRRGIVLMNYYSCQRPLPFIPWGAILISFGLQVWWCMIEPNINIKQQHTDLNGEWRRC